MNDVIAKRCKVENVSFVFVRNLILSIAFYIMTWVCFGLGDPTFLIILIMGIIFILAATIVMLFGIRSLVSNIKNNKLPKDAICLNGDELIINNGKTGYIKIKDIIKVKSSNYYKSLITANDEITTKSSEGTIVIKTNDKSYKVKHIDEVKDVHKIIDDIRDGKYHKTENIFNNIFNMDNNRSVYNSHDVFISINGEKTYSSKDSFDNEDNRCIFSNDDVVINVEDGDLNITIKKE